MTFKRSPRETSRLLSPRRQSAPRPWLLGLITALASHSVAYAGPDDALPQVHMPGTSLEVVPETVPPIDLGKFGPSRYPKRPSVRGFADLHTHQFAYLGFGGSAIAGSAFGPASSALSHCDRQQLHGPGGLADVMGNLIRKSETGQSPVGHHVGGYPEFDGWPHWSSVSHQQMWEEWLARAHRGGLRLMVMHAVNNAHFCQNAHVATGRTCNDQEAINLQLQAAKDMEAEMDLRAGGAGLGWYRIVRTPQEARSAITAGQLAVVLGIEVDDPFQGSDPAAALRQLDSYYQSGVRHMFPIHFKDNAVGGASFDKLLTVPTGTPGTPNIMHPYQMDVRACSPPYRREGGLCNARGLSALGSVVIKGMMSKGMMIDVDHMSELSFDEVLALTDAQHYPVVSGHTGFVDLAANASEPEKSHEGNLTLPRLQRIQAGGGMVGIIVNQGSLAQIDTFRGGPVVVEHVCGNSSETIAQAYLYAITNAPGMPIGLSTDMNAFLSMPGSRFASQGACPGGKGPSQSSVNTRRVPYPFVALASGQSMQKSFAVENDPGVTKTFDFNEDGLAHIGLMPDLIEDLRQLGISDANLEPLMSSAEGYLRVWERASSSSTTAQEASNCATLRSQTAGLEAQIQNALHELGAFGQKQKDCQAGVGRTGGARKPNQCVDNEDQAVQNALNARVSGLRSQLATLQQSKASARCWF